jgi:hypothetical protein
MNPRDWSLGQWIAAVPLIFVLGVVTAGASWKTNVDRTNCAQSDSITVNAEKYECLANGYVALQASDRVLVERVSILEARVDSMYAQNMKIQEAIYYELTGEEWQ